VVVAATDAEKLETLSDAAKGKAEWKIGVTTEFQQRPSGLTALNAYRLPMAASVRTVDPQQLFSLLEKRELTMVVTTATDGHLTSSKWKVLTDDQKVFPPEQAVLLVRTESLNRDPRVRAALMELAGKLPSDVMRRLNGEVDVEKKPIATVAAEFLASAGLK
jgi:glycine betaine/choline ABC-type transport system substrate-binding protein